MGFLDKNGLSRVWKGFREALSAKQDRLTGSPGQVVGFDSKGNAAAVPLSNKLEIGPNRIDIPANADLNDYLTVGNYKVGSNDSVPTLLNCPAQYAFTLDVLANISDTGIINETTRYAYFIQVLTTYTGEEWRRSLEKSPDAPVRFYKWERVVKESVLQERTNLALQSICPANKIVYDNVGKPGVYVQRAPRRLNELLTGGDSSVHPAFLVNDTQVSGLMIGKFQGKADGGRMYSLPGEDPATSISIDTCEAYCRNKGDGHHCITAAEWAFLALCAKKDGKMPKGNNNNGKDISETSRVAIPVPGLQDGGKTARTLTGTGPLAWSDTGDLTGIFDLNGNVWEWTSGIRLVKGELQVIPYNDAAAQNADTGTASKQWKAIKASAASWADLFITPNGKGTTSGSVKLDCISDHWQWGTTITNQRAGQSFSFAATTGSGLGAAAKLYLQAMALLPEDGAADADYGEDSFWANNSADELYACRGGGWYTAALAGVFHLRFDSPRSYTGWHIGGRPAYYE